MRRTWLYSLLFFLIGLSTAHAQECGVIYVTPSGATSGAAGTIANPADLVYGLSLVTASDTIVWLADGTYPISNTLTIPNGATIEGTFDPITWAKTNANTSTIARDALNPDLGNFALIALKGTGLSNFRLQDLNITVAAPTSPEITAYGIHLTSCSLYNITRCTITTGAGGVGTDGSTGSNGLVGSDGLPGIQGDDDNIINICGGNGGAGGGGGFGTGGTGGCTTGGSGATGGAGGTPASQCAGGGGGSGAGGGQDDNSGGTGGSGGGWSSSNNGGGSGGDGSGIGCNNTSSCGSSADGTNGAAGANGGNGTLGAVGPAGTNAGGYFIPGLAAATGICGTGGQGGAGGGGAGGEGSPFCSNGTGSTGGGGGGGGEGGGGGTGGTGGGGSFCIYLFTNGASGIVQDCALNPGTGGAGGIGGAGGTGSAGGLGAAGFPWFNSDLGCSGAGGNGGDGGDGGIGGSGSAGTSLPIYEHPGGVLVGQFGIINVPGNPPIITVQNPGCAFSEVIFSSTTSGNWTFGAGASPATASGTGPFSVIYATLGRRTINFSGTTFTDYIHIFNNGISGTFISPQDTTVTLGCPQSFTSTLSGLNYEWWFSGGTSPDTLAGSSLQTIDSVTFNAPGVYTLILKVTTGDSCCGVAFDTTTVTVDTSSFSLSMTSSVDTICQGDPMTFTASGAYTSYEFFVNGISVQNTPSNTYLTTSLLPGDSIVVVALSGSCFTNPSDTLAPTVVPIPSANLVSDDIDNTICGGDSVTFTATPAGYPSYDFVVNGTSEQAGVSNVFSTTSLLDGDSIIVLVPGLGCAGPSSNTIFFTVEPPPVVAITSSDPDTTICAGQSITFTVNPSGSTAYAFYYNGAIIQGGPSNTYLASSLVTGDQIFGVASSPSGCLGSTDTMTVTVNPVPTVSIVNSLDTICLNDPVSFVATASGMDSYEFFVNGVSAQDSSLSIFTTTSLADGDEVSVIATNLGCPSAPDTSIAISVISGPIISITAAPDSICAGDSLVVTALPSGYAGYEFFIGSTSVQNSASNVLTTFAANDGDTITVFASDFVCPGPQSNDVIVIVEQPTVTITGPTTFCDSTSVSVTALPMGMANYDFILNGASVQSGSSNMYISQTFANGDKIQVIPTSVNGCLGVSSNVLDMIVNPIPVIALTASDDTICLGDQMIFTASPAGMDFYVFSINKSGTVQNTSSNTYSTTGITNGDTIKVVASNLGCASLEVEIGPIVVISGPPVNIFSSDPDDQICTGDTVIYSVGPNGYTSYQFFVNGLPEPAGTDTFFMATNLSDGDIISVQAIDLVCPGLNSAATPITVIAIPVDSISSTSENICDGELVTFTALPALYDTYEFFSNGISVQNGAINTYQSSTLSDNDVITIIPTSFTCPGVVTDSITMTVNPLPTQTITAGTVCLGEVTTFTHTSNPSVLNVIIISLGDGATNITIPTQGYTYTDTGLFQLEVYITTSDGCSDTAYGTALVHPNPIADASSVPSPAVTSILNPVITFVDASSPPFPASITNWSWAFGDGATDSIQNPTYTYIDTGIYQVTLEVENQFGCTDNDNLKVTVEPEFTLHAPNTFSPNGDYINETFIPVGIGLEANFEMYIYDRWGDLIFTSTSINTPWDGKANGKKLAQEDVYAWVVTVKDYKRVQHKFVGHVTLIR